MVTDVGDAAFPPLLDIGVVVADGHGVFTIPLRDGPRDVAFAEVGRGRLGVPVERGDGGTTCDAAVITNALPAPARASGRDARNT